MKASVMKLFMTIMVLVTMATTMQADELTRAYEKEFAFLKAQKVELEKRLQEDQVQQASDLNVSKAKIETLQNTLLEVSRDAKESVAKLEKLSQALADKEENGGLMGNVLNQAQLTLEPYGIKLSDDNTTTDTLKIKEAFRVTTKLYRDLSSIRNMKGSFYLIDGKKVDGDITLIGNVAAYGISKEASGALAPAGLGQYKIWNPADTSDDAKALFSGERPESLDIFIYENIDKEVEYPKEESIKETLDKGGNIAYFILLLGALGIFLLLYRTSILFKAGSNVEEMSQIVVEKLKVGKNDEALDAIKKYEGATAKIIKATLRNIKSDREHIEDIVTENIINESSRIDQYGSFILVLAAVAPLVGLLGTVTGMITTFQDIAEFGTSDPNLLSGGISEALVNTELGLAVAIPLLLGGNLLSGWAQTIKDTMEQSALHIVNIYKKHNIQ